MPEQRGDGGFVGGAATAGRRSEVGLVKVKSEDGKIEEKKERICGKN